MIRFIQSYASPNSIGDSFIFKMVKDAFDGNIIAVPFYDKKTRNLSAAECRNFGFKNYKEAQNGDILFGWGADVVLYSWLRSLFWRGKSLTYISQNLIFNPEIKSLKQRVRFWLYKLALNNKHFHATVNSPGLIEYYSELFHCNRNKLHLVYDSMDLSESEQEMIRSRDDKNEPYVFFGGKAFRDVDTFIEIVRLLPNVKFKAVILESMIVPEMASLSNLEVYHDLEKTDFYQILDNASICCIPLKASIPCGLYVMQHAILMGIPIVSTETFSMRTIVPDDNHGFLMKRGDATGIAKKIEMLLNNRDLCEKIVNNAKDNMKNMTPEAVGKQICHTIKEIMDISNL